MKNLIIEGARGLGKSAVCRFLRENTTNSTLINFTGFNEGGAEGLEKVITYYRNWERFFSSNKGIDLTFIHDRYYFSEMPYSKRYKDYDFEPYFYQLLKQIPNTFENATLVVLWTDNKQELHRNLNRDKVALFGKEEESVQKSLELQLDYLYMANELKNMNIKNFKVELVNVAGKTIEEIGKEILALS